MPDGSKIPISYFGSELAYKSKIDLPALEETIGVNSRLFVKDTEVEVTTEPKGSSIVNYSTRLDDASALHPVLAELGVKASGLIVGPSNNFIRIIRSEGISYLDIMGVENNGSIDAVTHNYVTLPDMGHKLANDALSKAGSVEVREYSARDLVVSPAASLSMITPKRIDGLPAVGLSGQSGSTPFLHISAIDSDSIVSVAKQWGIERLLESPSRTNW